MWFAGDSGVQPQGRFVGGVFVPEEVGFMAIGLMP